MVEIGCRVFLGIVKLFPLEVRWLSIRPLFSLDWLILVLLLLLCTFSLDTAREGVDFSLWISERSLFLVPFAVGRFPED